jgi:hypothetical protein
MHMPCKDCVHAMLIQRLLHGLHHVIHLMLMRLVAVVPVRKVLCQFKVLILEQPRTLLSAQKGSCILSSMASIKSSTSCWCALLQLYLFTLQRVQFSSLPSTSGRCACYCCMYARCPLHNAHPQ